MAMTTLAEFALDIAYQHAQQALDAVHGAPLTASAKRAASLGGGHGQTRRP